jgi:hypothetical protein
MIGPEVWGYKRVPRVRHWGLNAYNLQEAQFRRIVARSQPRAKMQLYHQT